jgi:ankyrin repeat protein
MSAQHRRKRAQQKLLDVASRHGDINKLKQLLDEDPSLLDGFDNDVPEIEATDNPLHTAALHGHVDFTSEVLQLKPELAEKVNREGRLPLHLSAARGHLQVVQKLVDHTDQVHPSIYIHFTFVKYKLIISIFSNFCD